MRRIEIQPDVSVKVDACSTFYNPDVDLRINALWQEAQSSINSDLFNGTIYTVRSINPSRIIVEPAEYKSYFAQLADPELAKILSLRPLACSGFLTCDDGLIFAKRSDTVTLDKGAWELAPAGTFDEDCLSGDSLDARALIQKEMSEELGLPAQTLGGHQIIAAFEDTRTRAIDLIVQNRIALGEPGVRTIFERRRSLEYTQVKVIAMPDIPRFARDQEEFLSPITKGALAQLGLSGACSPSG